MEIFCNAHLSHMTKIFVLLILIGAVSCGQNKPSTKAFDTTVKEKLVFDTSKIALLPIDTSDRWLFKDANPVNLTNKDLKAVDKVLNDCINAHNSKQDTTKKFSEYINLENYKRQYVPFIDSKGEKKVYVNCFCLPDTQGEFDYWRQSLVQVMDGGSCFFQVTINLTNNTYEQLYTNGYA